jgi:hypothetical protein
VLLEIYPAGIAIKLGYSKNYLGYDNAISSFEPAWKDTFNKHTYMDEKGIELEMNHIVSFFKSEHIKCSDKRKQKIPEKVILALEAENTHIHGGATTLQGIADYIEQKNDSYHNTCNAIDRNKKHIKCFETKYFYSYVHGNRLAKGIVIHKINNMWWVICNDQLLSISSFDLMDFDPALPKRLFLSSAKKLNKLENILSKEVTNRNFKKCEKIQEAIQKLQAA